MKPVLVYVGKNQTEVCVFFSEKLEESEYGPRRLFDLLSIETASDLTSHEIDEAIQKAQKLVELN